MNLIYLWLLTSIAIIIAAYLVPGVTVSGFGTALVAALVLGIINVSVKPLLIILTLPINILTLGLFTFVINAFVIELTSFFVPGFAVKNFAWALIFSLILSIVAYVLHVMTAGSNPTAP